MSYTSDPMDQANPDWLQPADPADHMEAMQPSNPAFVARAFLSALGNLDDPEVKKFLGNFTTPESRPAWGDFKEAAAYLDSIPEWGLGTVGNRALGDDAVHYLGIFSGVKENLVATEDQIAHYAAVLTLAWCPPMGVWLVHSLGGEYVRPEHVPHY